MRFSQRIGKSPVREAFQVKSMDDDLKTTLWNVLYTFYLEGFTKVSYTHKANGFQFAQDLWRDFFKWSIDSIPGRSGPFMEKVRAWFKAAEWDEVYDLIEHVAQYNRAVGNGTFEAACNNFLEREMSGYRFLDTVLVQITSEAELAEIEAALQNARRTALTGVQEHLSDALTKLSDRKNPDYRNSIKESISAVESIARVISGESTLGKALKIIEDRVGLHPALKKGFSAIYGYTSDEGGIRHALMESPNCDFEDAKYMLVSCSAFINYLVVKADKAGISLD